MDIVQIASVVTIVGGLLGAAWLTFSPREESYAGMEERLLLLRVTGLILVPAFGLVNMGLDIVVAGIFLAALLVMVDIARRRRILTGDEVRIFAVWAAAGFLVWATGVFRPAIEFLYMLAAGVIGAVIIVVDRCFGGRCRIRDSNER